jgi:plasmid stabilization system protein ParE
MINSALYYDRQSPGQGDRFLKAVEATEAAIREQPQWGQPGEAGTRTWRIRNFPFAMIYKEFPDRITVFAVAHFSRKPRYWTERL